MIALVLAACTSLPTVSDVGGSAPPEWIRVASSDGRWRGSFPTWPILSEVPQTVQLGEEPARSVVVRWTQSSPSWGSYAVGTVPQTPAILASTEPRKIAAGAALSAAERMGGVPGPPEDWDAFEGGVRGDVRLDGRFAGVAAGVVDGVLVLVHATARDAGSVDGFLDTIQAYGGDPPVQDLAVGEGVRARCPAFCGPLGDTASIGGIATELSGFRGVLDGHRFELVVAPLRPGVDPLAAQEALRARFVQRVQGQLTDVRSEALDGNEGVRARYHAGLAVGEVRTGIVGEEVVAAEVWAGSGGIPGWGEGFLTSIARR